MWALQAKGKGKGKAVGQQAAGKGAGKAAGGKAAGKAAPAAVKEQAPRQRVTQQRVTGTLSAWKGKFGWVQPDQPIKHPLAQSRKGQLFLSQEDVERDIDGIGQSLSFFVYADSSGLGAMHCVPATGNKAVQKVIEKPAKKAVADNKKPAKGKGKGAPKGEKPEKKEAGQAPDKANRSVISQSPIQGTVVDWRGQVGWIRPDEAVEELEGPERKKHQGLLYVHTTDVDGEMPLVGAQVVYFMYSDEAGLGAEMCQVVAQGDGEPPEGEGKKAAKTKTAPVQKKAFEKKGKAMPKKSVQRPQGEKKAGGPDLPRERIMDIALTGEVAVWRGKFGFIQPTEPIEHPEAAKHGGKLYVNVKDLVGAEKLEKGAMVQFQVFADASGLGAEEVLVL